MHIHTRRSDLQRAVHPVTGRPADYDSLLEMIGDARLVLLGEASHGTHEFYRERAEITKRLIRERGFTAVAAEADWPDAHRVNRYVQGAPDDAEALEALGWFKRFPAWMWRNRDVLQFVRWLRAHNDGLPPGARKTGFYGLDLYSLFSSIEAVVRYLEAVDPGAADRARERYACFEHFQRDPELYARAALNGAEPCEDAVVQQLVDLHARSIDYLRRDGRVAEDEYFYAEQNARVAVSAERYYRLMFRGRESSWNLRDRHMADTMDRLLRHLDERGPAKIVVWEHNSHIGDARATEMGQEGELNVGQLAREHYAGDCRLIGFATYSGTVTAASAWGGEALRKRVRPALAGSYEALFRCLGVPGFLLLTGDEWARESLEELRLERAIGVIYRPQTERLSHYFHARLGHQFDAIIHFDETKAVEPLEPTPGWEEGDLPETFPHAI